MNQLIQMVNLMRNGGNPIGFLQMMANNNPVAAQVLNLCKGKNASQLEEIAKNLAKNNGTTIEDVARSLGISIPSNR